MTKLTHKNRRIVIPYLMNRTLALVIMLLFVFSGYSQTTLLWDGSDWTEGSGSHGIFTRLGSDQENTRVIGAGPNGSNTVIWRAGSDVANNGDGGWNIAFNASSVDNTKTYRYSAWVKRTGDLSKGRTYHGTRNVTKLDGTPNANPYFFSGYLPQLDTWYLMVGIVHPAGYTGEDTGVGGLYDVNGNKVRDFIEYKWDGTATTTRMRSYYYYSTDLDSYQFFWNPMLETIDSNLGDVSDIINDLQSDGLYTSVEDAPSLNGQWNQVSSINFDYAGTSIGKSKGYFNLLGNAVQNLNWDAVNNKIWANQTLYDRHGRPALQTLNAPVEGGLTYSSDFILAGSTSYGTSHFDVGSTVSNPSMVSGNSELGTYYSIINTEEPYQDVTSYPFDRSVYSKLNPGSVQRNLGGNKIGNEWKQTYSFTMAAGNELASSAAFGNSYNPNQKVFKSVSRNIHGMETVVFLDNEGSSIAAARSGNETGEGVIFNTSRSVGKQGFIDIHLPVGVNSFTISNPSGISYTRYDLISETVINTNSPGAGFYRISIDDVESYRNSNAVLTVSHLVNYYDYSLNQYDKVKRLIKSTQPVSQTLYSTFNYNSLGQLLESSSSDEGVGQFKYRKDGQVRFSQNSRQVTTGAFSYTHYDELARPTESGVYDGPVSFASANANIEDGLADIYCSEVSKTYYDLADDAGLQASFNAKGCNQVGAQYKQEFVAGNVVKATTTNPEAATTWYGYDVLGKVIWVVQSIEGLDCPKTIDYAYDPSTGQVNRIDYQRNDATERFLHRYTYNEVGQLVAVHTSRDDLNYLLQAEYEYTDAGILKRTILAENLQGIDYVYNLNGQLKAINHPSLNPINDPGEDGGVGSDVAADVFGFALDYYNGDYSRGGTPTPIAQQNANGIDQYNGNIKAVRFNTTGFEPANGGFNTYQYNYSKNEWLSTATFGRGSIQPIAGNKHQVNFTANGQGDYKVDNLAYDANGNIQSLARKGYTDGQSSNEMDDLTYIYDGNQLQNVIDQGDNPDPDRYDDIRNLGNNGNPNYIYNAIGQLTADIQGGAFYEYNAAGLVTQIRSYVTGTTGSISGEAYTLYEQDYGESTNGEISLWTFPIGNGNTSTINVAGTYGDLNETACGTLNNRYGRSRGFNLGTLNTASRIFDVIPNISQSLSLDVIVDQWQPIVQNGESHEKPAGYRLEILDGGGNLLQSRVFNEALEYIDDPDLGSGACSKFYDNQEVLNFTPTSSTITFQLSRLSNSSGNGLLPIYLDNIKISSLIVPLLDIAYNERGQRVKKTSYNTTTGLINYTYYVRDASGNILGIYKETSKSKKPRLDELTVYGNSRIGTYSPNSFAAEKPTGNAYGNYLYELTDHLGNVRAVLSKTSTGVPYAVSKTDYYPFGMPMPNRQVIGGYRYTYQGQEKDPETGKEAFELRLWDARIGRWLTVDPYGEFFSPYLGMGNNPVKFVDIDGGRINVWHNSASGVLTIYEYRDGELYDKNNNKYTGNDTFLTDVRSALRDLDYLDIDTNQSLEQSKIVTTGFINHLVKAKQTFSIHFASGSMKTSGTSVYVDPANDPSIPVYKNNKDNYVEKSQLRKRPFSIGLVHELGHAFDNAYNISSKSEWLKYDSNGDGIKDKSLSSQEQFGSAIENIFRAKLGLPLRNFYINGIKETLLLNSSFETIWTNSNNQSKLIHPRYF